MYEQFYKLTEKPFSILPDPSFLYMTEKHSSVMTMLEYGLMNQSAGITVVTGEIGAGKTTLLRNLVDKLAEQEDINLAMLSNTHASFGDLLEWVCMSFSIDYKQKSKVELHEAFQEHLIEQYAQGKSSVLIIDEAQNLTAPMLEELRMLSNINNYKDVLLSIFMVGQPELRANLENPELMQFAQRVTGAYHLEALNRGETRDYIVHRLRTAGREEELFDEGAIDAIWYYSKGVPRTINVICDAALVYGYGDNRQSIDKELVIDVVKDKMKGGIPSLGLAQLPQGMDIK